MQGSEVRRRGDVEQPRHPREGRRCSLYERRNSSRPRRTERQMGLVERPRSLLGDTRQSGRAELPRSRARAAQSAKSHRETSIKHAQQIVQGSVVGVAGREDSQGTDQVHLVRPDKDNRQQAVYSSMEESGRRIVAHINRSPFSAEETPLSILASRGSPFRRERARIH